MEYSERETLILINLADLEDGFFKISTNIPSHRRRIEKRAKGKILDFKEEKLNTGEVFGWEFKIQASALNQKLFCIESPRKTLSPEVLEARRALAKINLGKVHVQKP